jgi:hypothetical protein
MNTTDTVVGKAAKNRYHLVMAVLVRHRSVEITETVVAWVLPEEITWGGKTRRKTMLPFLNQKILIVLLTERLLASIVGNFEQEIVSLYQPV